MQNTLDETFTTAASRPAWLDRPALGKLTINLETILFLTILLVGVISRTYDLGVRVMSHDENTHVYYSWNLYKGQPFYHDPLMHGPFQFHLVALSYFMFGDNDFTGRLSQALFAIAAIAFVWNYRRYLGKTGALIAAGLMVISPYMLFYGRYARNEAYVMLFGVVTLWAILRYLESGQARYLIWLTAVTALHFTAKETSFIYAAQALLFLGLYLVGRISTRRWGRPTGRVYFLLALILAIALIAGALIFVMAEGQAAGDAVQDQPVFPGEGSSRTLSTGALSLVILGVLALLAAVFFLFRDFGWRKLREERSFDLLVLLGTLVLPQLAAFPLRFLGWKAPTNINEINSLLPIDLTRIGLVLIPLLLVSLVIGLIWSPRRWLINAAVFYGIFIIFYTTLFTYGAGIITGFVGSLGYWLAQQGVNRGSQPWYYYALIQIPVYEYLPLLGSLLAAGIVVLSGRAGKSALSEAEDRPEEEDAQQWSGEHDFTGEVESNLEKAVSEEPPVVPLLAFWAVSSMVAFTFAGEKMPWLTVHIALPLILLAGWGIGRLVDGFEWMRFRERRTWGILALLAVFVFSLLSFSGSLLGANPPFAGKDLESLSHSGAFLAALIVMLASGFGFFRLTAAWSRAQTGRLLGLFVFALLSVTTGRTAYAASFINYDNANELLVYAHSAGGVKEALAQIEELSRVTTDGLGLAIAYDNETSYPYLWYFRNYPNRRYFGADPSRSLRESPAILVGDANYGKIEPVVRDEFISFDYIRLWWPNQEYFGLTWERIRDALTNGKMRQALFQIWFNRDYTEYGETIGRPISLETWSPATRMRLYIRKDIAAKLWQYGISSGELAVQTDPYEGKGLQIAADQIIGSPGSQPGQFQRPRDLAVASDGSIYVCDTDNHRIQHLAPDGAVLQAWGTFADVTQGAAPGGTFNAPWGIDVGLDGSVYVADTWNHRIQKFSAQGEFITMWGYFGQAESPEAFWGPRDVVVDARGRVLVSDTGNKRIVVFDEQGNFLSQFGKLGMNPGEFDEQVGLAVDSANQIYVADTWNQRIQVFTPAEGSTYIPLLQWEIAGWYGQSLDNKPYLDMDNQGRLFVADPEGCRVLEFTATGGFVRYWGDCGTGAQNFSLAAAVAVDPQGGVWVSDAGNSRLMHFTLP